MDHSSGKEYYEYVLSFLRSKKDFDNIPIHNERDSLSTCNAIVSQLSGNHAFVAPCQKIIKYLKHMKNGSYEENHRVDDCSYLNLYINDNADSFYGNTITSDTYNTFIKDFITKYPELKNCSDYMTYIDKDVIGDVKKILDMYEKLNKVINHSNPTNDDTCNNIDKCLDIYMSFQPQCKNGSENELCNALENFRNFYLVNSQRVMRCTDDTNFPSFKVAQEYTSDQDDSPNPPDLQFPHGQDDPAGLLGMKESLGQDDSSSKSSNSKTVTAISTTLLLFPTLFSLYKVYKEFLSKQKIGFTPLGSFIRPYIHRNEKVQYNANDEMLQLYLPNYKAQNNINKEQLNVPYHS